MNTENSKTNESNNFFMDFLANLILKIQVKILHSLL